MHSILFLIWASSTFVPAMCSVAESRWCKQLAVLRFKGGCVMGGKGEVVMVGSARCAVKGVVISAVGGVVGS